MFGWRTTRTTKSSRLTKPLALLGVLVISGWGAWTALAASAPPTPTITSSPANPTNAASATFKYTSAGATSFSCKLDATAAFTTCATTGITYTGLAPGSHTFQVQAADKNGHTSSPESYSWVVDTTAPTVSSIVRADANPTKAASLRWTVTFNEPVKNVATTNFTPLVTSNLGGTAPTVTSVAPTGSAPTSTWTVTVASSGTTGTNNGSIQLNLTAKGTIQDAATNPLGGSTPLTGQAYTFDTTAPATGAVSIARNSGTPTNATSVSWTVSFGEAVTGVAAANLSLVASGFSGTPAITAVTGSGATRTVTATTGTGTPSGSATLQLRLSSASGIADLAGNALSGSLPVDGATYTVDRLAPPVAFATKPPDPNSVSTSQFSWTSAPAAADFDHFECSTENGPFGTQVSSVGGAAQPCGSPLTYVVGTTNNGQHQFDVRAYDHLGNFTQITYSWKVEAGSIQDFTMSGNLASGDLLYPGGPSRTIPVRLNNPNGVPITVTAFTVSVDAATLPSGCQAGWFPITQSDIAGTAGVSVPANGSTTLPAGGATAPKIRMSDSGNQDACRNATFTLRYTDGSAHS